MQATITLFNNKEIKVPLAVFLWVFVTIIAVYCLAMVAAFNVIGWFFLVFLTVCPLSYNGISIDPWPKYVSMGLHVILQAISVYYWFVV